MASPGNEHCAICIGTFVPYGQIMQTVSQYVSHAPDKKQKHCLSTRHQNRNIASLCSASYVR